MKPIRGITLVAVAFATGGSLLAAPATAQEQEQEVAPIFEQVPAILYETYRAVNNPAFSDYFEMLVEKYGGTDGTGWAIYRENAKTAYRITVLPNGLESLAEIQRARRESFQEFTEEQVALWNAGWGTRHVAVYRAAPAMSVVPEGFTVDDIRALPYHRTSIYHLKWNQAGAFRQALRERSALDREAGIENFALTAWNGGIGTPAQVVMIRVSAENRGADAGPNYLERRQARESYIEEWLRLNGIMNEAVWRI